MGIFSTQSSVIHIDNIDPTLTTVPIELLPIITPEYEKSDAIYTIANYLVRVSPTTNFDFNYQPLANGINVKWVAVEYPADYYKKGGNKTSYLRDEVYALFIRWIYDTGVKSSSYHIPGRAATPYDTTVTSQFPMGVADTLLIDTKVWQTYNTATIDPSEPLNTPPLLDGGVEIAAGYMGYWESTEIYPDDKPTIWNASSHPTWPGISSFPSADLCGESIRHHKMPDQSLPGHKGDHFRVDPTGAAFYRFLGIRVENIQPPVDNNGKLIANIVGYEILRGTREGNKTIIAKGMVNNTREYELTPGVSNSRVGIYQNYPYNPLEADVTLTTKDPSYNGGFGASISGPLPPAINNISQNVYTFHSPDTQFKNPFLSVKELKLYGEIGGIVTGAFSEVPDHPTEKLMGDLSFLVAAMIGLGAASLAIRGKRTTEYGSPSGNQIGLVGTITDAAAIGVNAGLLAGWDGTTGTAESLQYTMANILTAIIGLDASDITIAGAGDLIGINPTVSGGFAKYTKEFNEFTSAPPLVKAFNGIMAYTHYWTLGTDTAMRLMESIVPYQQYAYRYLSHGWYNSFNKGNVAPGNYRRLLNNANYLENQFQDFGG